MRLNSLFLGSTLCISLTSCITTPSSSSIPASPSSKITHETSGDAPSKVTPEDAIATALRYTNHSWKPFSRNVLHDKDAGGVIVHTPDISWQTHTERRGWWIPGESNRGIPYKWGGFDSPASFDQAIANGAAAGDVSSPAKRQADQAAVSPQAAGVDCSGFVSRCLNLPTVYDTTQLPSICDKLASPLELRPGDLLNIPRGHVILCAGWAQPDRSWIYYYDTGSAPDHWRPSLKQAPLKALLELGYQPLRYKGMQETGKSTGKEVLTRSVRSSALIVEKPSIGEP